MKEPLSSNGSRNFSGSSNSSHRTPSMEYKESGHRAMERMDAQSLRKALEQIDVKKEHKLYNAARDEAAELVWKHQNPNAPYRYPGNIGASGHSRSQSLAEPEGAPKQSYAPERKQRYSYSGLQAPFSINDSKGEADADSLGNLEDIRALKSSKLISQETPPPEKKSYGLIITNNDASKAIVRGSILNTTISGRRKSSGSKRRTSGSLFRNPADQIYEEPEEMKTPKGAASPEKQPSPLLQAKRNPFSRAYLAKNMLSRSQTDPTQQYKRLEKFEIQRNPPSQSRDPSYMTNSLLHSKGDLQEGSQDKKQEGCKEIRSDDIRAATSMKLRDRSTKLPTPTIVSDRPGRPIVSFQSSWKPKEVELKMEESEKASTVDVDNTTTKTEPKSLDVQAEPTSNNGIVRSNTAPASVPSISVNEVPSQQPVAQQSRTTNHFIPPPDPPTPERLSPLHSSKYTSSVSVSAPLHHCVKDPISASAPPVLTITEPKIAVTPPVPSIKEPMTAVTPPLPIINEPSISVTPPMPRINEPGASFNHSSRPLPTPSRGSAKAKPAASNRFSRLPWQTANIRTGALCAQCALPIAGRIVTAAGSRFHPECFTCHHCGEGLECVAFYPEPESALSARRARITARLAGENVPEYEDMDGAEDPDKLSLRFYCHLDYHEFFSPRCKSCKTPIEGEVVVACGAEWHVGHFFCAQCGDPFDAATPFVEKDGYAWCVGCHTNRYSAKCRKCRRPVTETVVKALGAEWHAECFVCVVSTHFSAPFPLLLIPLHNASLY